MCVFLQKVTALVHHASRQVLVVHVVVNVGSDDTGGSNIGHFLNLSSHVMDIFRVGSIELGGRDEQLLSNPLNGGHGYLCDTGIVVGLVLLLISGLRRLGCVNNFVGDIFHAPRSNIVLDVMFCCRLVVVDRGFVVTHSV
jgi:hypothetical protein